MFKYIFMYIYIFSYSSSLAYAYATYIEWALTSEHKFSSVLEF